MSRRSTEAGRGAVLALVCALSACSIAEQGASDGPAYASVDELAAESDLVVHGVVGELRGREVDDGGNDGGGGPEIAFYDVVVTDVLQGTRGTPSVVVGTSGDDGYSAALAPGQEVVLFLEQLTPADAPGIDTETEFSVVVGGRQGAFVVDGETATSGDELEPIVVTLDVLASTLGGQLP